MNKQQPKAVTPITRHIHIGFIPNPRTINLIKYYINRNRDRVYTVTVGPSKDSRHNKNYGEHGYDEVVKQSEWYSKQTEKHSVRSPFDLGPIQITPSGEIVGKLTSVNELGRALLSDAEPAFVIRFEYFNGTPVIRNGKEIPNIGKIKFWLEMK